MAEWEGEDLEQQPVEIHPQDIATRLAAYRRHAAAAGSKDAVIDLTAAEGDVLRSEAGGGAVVVLPDEDPT